MSSNELPKIIDKTQADIDSAIAAIKSCDLPRSTKDFAISCIRLAIWLPKALLEQKIRLSNLRKLIFGSGQRNKKKQNKDNTEPANKPEAKQPDNDAATAPAEPIENKPPVTTNCTSLPGHGRLPHSAYTNIIEHTLVISNLKPGHLCPEHCGGRLYHYEPGILVRVAGVVSLQTAGYLI